MTQVLSFTTVTNIFTERRSFLEIAKKNLKTKIYLAEINNIIKNLPGVEALHYNFWKNAGMQLTLLDTTLPFLFSTK